MFHHLLTFAVGVGVLHLISCSSPNYAASGLIKQFKMLRPCKKYDGDGCSIPFGLPFFYKRQFTLSCDRHDVCYHCGVAYGISRARCDRALRNNTLATCRSNYFSSSKHITDTSYFGSKVGDSHQARFLQTVEEIGADGLSQALEKELVALNQACPTEPGFKDFTAWFSDRKVQLRVLAEWVGILAVRHGRVDLVSSLFQADLNDLSRHLALKKEVDNTVNLKQVFLDLQKTGSKHEKEYISKKAIKNVILNDDTLFLDNDVPLFTATVKDADKDHMWCSEVAQYLEAKNEMGPLSAMTCADISYLTCNFFSEIYFLAVRLFAYTSYHQEPEFYCHESFVPKCLPPLAFIKK